MADTTTLTLLCQCGASKLTAHVDDSKLPLQGYLCHCNGCQHSHGTLCNTSAFLPSELAGNTSTLTKHSFSPRIDTFFCTTCGSNMFGRFHLTEGKSVIIVKTGVLQDAGIFVQFTRHVFVESTKDGGFADWLHEIDGKPLARLKEHDGSGEVPRGWKSGDSDTDFTAKEIAAYCRCNGVQFYITRPNAESADFTAPISDLFVKMAEEHKPKVWWLKDDGRYLAGTCACDSCRLAAGVDIVEWAFVPAANIKLPGGEAFRTDFGTLKEFQSREDVKRYFCSRCGANVFWTGKARPELIDVAVGLLDSPAGARAEDWLSWAKNRVSFEEDAQHKSLAAGLARGLAAWQSNIES